MSDRTNRRIATKRLKDLTTKGVTRTPEGLLLAPGWVTKALADPTPEKLQMIKSSRIIYINDEEKFQIMELLKGNGFNPTERKFIKV